MRRSEPQSWFGLDEAVLLVALGLLVAGLWSRIGMVSLTVPGAVLLWIVLPPRQAFVRAEREITSRKGT
jgi:hypothetical protein